MNKSIYFILILFLVGCGGAPSDSAIQTAIAETQAALPPATEVPTDIPVEVAIDTEVPATEIPIEEPIVDDSALVFDYNPKKLLMEKNDIPWEGEYYIGGADWNSPLRNLEIISSIGVTLGKEYLAATGRIDGWKIGFLRGSQTEILPEDINNVIALHETPEGAMSHMLDYGTCLDRSTGFREINTSFQVGDLSSICTMSINHASGERRETLMAEFVYHNLYVTVTTWGWEDEITPEFIIEITNSLFERLTEFELSDSVFFLP